MQAALQFFPLLVDRQAAASKVEALLSQKGWQGTFKITEKKLSYVPLWFFNFDVFSETTDSLGNKKINFHEKGTGAINALTTEFADEFSYLKGLGIALGEKPKEVPVQDFKKPAIEKEHLKDVLSVRLAAKKGVAKENALVFGFEFCYVPIWKITAEVQGRAYYFSVIGADGKVFGSQSVPLRQKNQSEKIRTAISKAKEPSQWIDFFSDMLKGLGAAMRRILKR